MKYIILILAFIFSSNLFADYKVMLGGKVQGFNNIPLKTDINENFDANGATDSNVSLSSNMKIVSNEDGGIYINGSFTKYNAYSGNFFAGIEREGTVGSTQRAWVLIEVPSSVDNYNLSFYFIGDSYENSSGPMSNVIVEAGSIIDGVFSKEAKLLDQAPSETNWIKYEINSSYSAIKITLENGNGSSKNNVSGRFHYVGIDNIILTP